MVKTVIPASFGEARTGLVEAVPVMQLLYHRQRCYELLNEVRLTGDWETWLDFFADAVIHM